MFCIEKTLKWNKKQYIIFIIMRDDFQKTIWEKWWREWQASGVHNTYTSIARCTRNCTRIVTNADKQRICLAQISGSSPFTGTKKSGREIYRFFLFLRQNRMDISTQIFKKPHSKDAAFLFWENIQLLNTSFAGLETFGKSFIERWFDICASVAVIIVMVFWTCGCYVYFCFCRSCRL